MVTAYSMIANGGRRVKATLIDRIQDRYGHTIFKHDQRECRGCDAPGGHLAAPIARDFLKLALADKPPIPFKVPAGIKLIRVVSKTGMRAGPGETAGTILEAFKPGTAPPDNYSVIGVADADGRVPQGISPDAGNIMRPGTGGLY
jgi:penicillin-binding protein 1A